VVWFYVLGPQPPEVAVSDDPGAALDIAEARSEVKLWPFRASKWGRLGIVLSEYDFDREAITCLARATQLSPSSSRWPYLQGVLQARSDLDAGVALLKRSVQLDGSAAVPRLALAETLLQLGRTDEAEEHFQFVFQRDPDNARALLGKGRVAHDRGDLTGSLDYLKRSAAIESKIKATHAQLAEVYQRLDDQKHAEMERMLAASLSPITHWPDPYWTLSGPPLRGQKMVMRRASALLKENRAKEAIELLNELTASGVEWYRKDLVLGRAYVSLGDDGAAEKAFRKALRLKPDSFEVLTGLGLLLKNQDKYAPAAELFRKALALQSDAGPWHFQLGRCLEMQGQTAEAIVEYREAARLLPTSWASLRSLGSALHAKGQDTEALAALEKACQMAPKDVEARQLLATVRESLGLPKQKDEPMEKVVPAPNPGKPRPESPD
jgi:tetratricopeptide (TPR) repeat protein